MMKFLILLPSPLLEELCASARESGLKVSVLTAQRGRGLLTSEAHVPELMRRGNFHFKSVTDSEIPEVRYVTPVIRGSDSDAIAAPRTPVPETSPDAGAPQEIAAPLEVDLRALVRTQGRCRVVVDPPDFALHRANHEQLMRLSVELQREVTLRVYESALDVPPQLGPGLTLHIWSSAIPKRTFRYPREVCGFSVESSECFRGSGHGIPLLDDEGVLFGELVDEHNAYVHVALGVALRERDDSFVRLLVERLLHFLRSPREEWATLFRRLRQIERDIMADRFTSLHDTSAHARREAFEQLRVEAIAALEEERTRLLEHFAAYESALEKQRQALRRVRSEGEAAFEELEKLRQIPEVEDVVYLPDRLIVYTGTLTCRNPETGRTHLIGKMVMEMFPDSGVIRYTNRTVAVGVPAPHVNAEGAPCLGAYKQTLPQAIERRAWRSAVLLAIQFVMMVNPKDAWGARITNFPLI